MLSSRQEIADFVREKGYRATPQRITIYEALCNSGSHPTVAAIHSNAIARDSSISLATVYKTLQLFVEIGLVREMGFRDESTRYDPRTDDHLNLVCTKCGRVEDFDASAFDQVVSAAVKAYDFKLIGQRFEVYGVCSSCRSS